MKKSIIKCSIFLTLFMGSVSQVVAQDNKTPYAYIPDTISEQAKKIISNYENPNLLPTLPERENFKAWTEIQKARDEAVIKSHQGIVKRLQPVVSEREIGGVPVLDVKPAGWNDNGKIIVYTHGGAYTLFSAKSTLPSAALMADFTGLRVISIDYTLAPHAKWQQVTDQVLSVFRELHKNGHSMSDIAIWGDSAGGGLAAGSVLKMRDKGMDMPAAVVLWSPWADITDTGDTYTTLKHADPAYVYEKQLKPSADAYADPVYQKKSLCLTCLWVITQQVFPQPLFKGGPRRLFLSNFVPPLSKDRYRWPNS